MPITPRGLGISTNADMIDGDDDVLDAHLGHVADAGCSHAELILHGLDVVINGALRPERVAAVERVLRRRRLSYTIHLPYDLNLWDPDWAPEAYATFGAGLDFAEAIGAEAVVYHSSFRAAGHDEPTSALLERDRDQLAALGEHARRAGTVIGVENNAFTDPSATTYGLRPRDLARHVEQVDHPNVGITLDLGHLFLTSTAYGWSMREEIEAVLPLLRHVHAHDNFAKLSRGPRYNSELPRGIGDLHLPMGWGTIDWSMVVDAMSDYRGVWMMEIEYRFFRHFPELVKEARLLLDGVVA